MPTFCRHNRFIERCPICSKTLPGNAPTARSSRSPRSARSASAGGASAGGATRSRRPRGETLRVRREGRAEDDGYSSELLPGLHASADARRLAEEIAFSSGRLLGLQATPPGLYSEARAFAENDLDQATWICFLISYLSPLDSPGDGHDPDDDPFAGVRLALADGFPDSAFSGGAGDLDEIPLGPRTSHDSTRGTGTLLAYRQLVRQSGGQARWFSGDAAWSPERRFERLFERLALPGFGRMGRYDLLVTLGRLGLYDMRAGSLHLAGAGGLSSNDLTTLAAKRLFAIGESIHLERRAGALASAISVPVEVLDLALANWASPQRATQGFPSDTSDHEALARAHDALGL